MLFFVKQESSDNCTNIAQVVSIVPFAKLEFIMEKSMFLIEDSDSCQSIAKDLQSSHNNSVMTLFQVLWTIILQDSPNRRFGHNDTFNFCHHFENIDHLIAGIVESFASQQELDAVLLCHILVVSEENVVADVRFDHVHGQYFNSCFSPIKQVLLHLL